MNGLIRMLGAVLFIALTVGRLVQAQTAEKAGKENEDLTWRSYFVPQAGRAYHNAIQLYNDNAAVLMIGGSGVPEEFTVSAPSKPFKSAAVPVGGDAWTTLNGWQWVRAGYPDEVFFQMDAGLVELTSQLFLIGGNYTGQVWTSTDGSYWNLLMDAAPWGARQHMAVATFAGYIWLIGGLSYIPDRVKAASSDSTLSSDIWRSADGLNWEQVTANAPWGGCFGARAIAFNDQLWLIGGVHTGGDVGGVKASEINVWHSSDGLEWSAAAAPTPWSERIGHACVVFNGKLWMLGGQDLATGNSLNDVWSTVDGEQWEQELNIPWQPRQYHATVTVEGLHGPELWMIGGVSFFYGPDGLTISYQFRPEVWIYGAIPGRVSLTVASPVNGQVYVFPRPAADGTYEENTLLTAWAAPSPGYRLAQWTGALSGSTNPIEQILLRSPVALGAVFEPDTSVRLIISESLGGSVAVYPEPDQEGTYAAGTTVTLSAQPDSGYEFRSWRGDISGTQSPLSLRLDRNVRVVPVFAQTPSGAPLPWAACFSACEAAVSAGTSPPDSDGDGMMDCQELCVGTDPNLTDTDGDGMPDGWELRYRLIPTNPLDALLDPDEDGLTNLEEFLRQSYPLDPASPGLCVFVDPNDGQDASNRGSRAAPLRTLTFALSVISGTPELPSRVLLRPGEYGEPGLLRVPPNVWVIGLRGETPPAPNDPPEVMLALRLILAEQTELAHIMLREPDMDDLRFDVPMVQVTGPKTRIRNVWFQGSGLGLTAMHVLESALSPVTVERCTFFGVGTGIRMDGVPPRLRLNHFDFLLGPALVFAAGSDTKDDPAGLTGAGDASDPNTGFNRFGPENAEPVVVNERTDTLYLQNNDWATDDLAAAEKRVESAGPVVIAPVVVPGSALLANSLFCTVVDAAIQLPVTSATTTLRISAYRPVTENESGVYAYPAVPDGSYTLTVSASGYQDQSVAINLAGGTLKSITVGLVPDGGTVEPEPQPEPEPKPEPEPEPGPEPEPRKGCLRCRRDQADAAPQTTDLADTLLMGLGLLALARPRPHKKL